MSAIGCKITIKKEYMHAEKNFRYLIQAGESNIIMHP